MTRYTEHVCAKTMKKYMFNLTMLVQTCIKQNLPSKFALMFDGWTDGSEHYTALYAVYVGANNKVQQALLAFTPLDEVEKLEDNDLSAESHYCFLTGVLEEHYNKHFDECVVCLIGDNCATNKKTAELLKVPLVGCFSHKLSLEVKNMVVNDPQLKRIVDTVHEVMKTAKNVKVAMQLRKHTALHPIINNVTRWSSTFEMLRRYIRMEEAFHKIEELLPKLLDPTDRIALNVVISKMTNLESYTKALQEDKLSLAEGWMHLDNVRQNFPEMCKYIAHFRKVLSDIIHMHPSFCQ